MTTGNNHRESFVQSFWLASYPRSGNTLARITISQALLAPEDQSDVDTNFPSLDIVQSTAEKNNRVPIEHCVVAPLTTEMGSVFSGTWGNVRFVKTHWCSPDIMDLVPSIGAAYLVRHPVDVFLSGLNYMYVNAARIEAFREYFLGASPVSVATIVERGDLLHYVDDFIANEGFWPFQFGSGTWSESLRQWSSASRSRNVKLVTYSRFVEHRSEALREITEAAGLTLTPEQIVQGVEGGEEATRPDGKFFWRGGGEVKRGHIPADRISRMEKRMYESAGIDIIPAGL